MRSTLPFLLALLLVAACGDDKPEAKTEAQRPTRHVAGFARQSVPDLGRLVPADAVALAVFAPHAKLQPKLDAFFESVASRPQPVLDQLLAMSGTSRDEIDADRPFAVALTLDEENRPQPTFILPAKGGDYVAKGHATPAAAKAPPLARDLPGGDVVFRLDLARIVPAFRPVLDPYLSADGLVGLDPALSEDPKTLAMLDAMGAGARALLDSAERLEGAVALDGGVVDLNLALSVKEGSALDTPPAKGASLLDLAKSIDAKRCAMTMLMRSDSSAWLDAFVPFLRSMYAGLPDGETRLKRYLQAYRAMYEAMGPSFAMGIDFDVDGVRAAGVMRPDDGAAYLARYREAIVEGSMPEMGVAITPAEPVEVDGAKLDVFKVEMDWRKLMASAGPRPPGFDEKFGKVMDAMFGPAGIRYAQGVVGDRVITAVAGRDGSYDHAVATAKERSGGLAPVVAAAVEPQTTLLFHIDLRRMLRSTVAIVSKAMPQMGPGPTIPDGPPVNLWLRVGQDGRTYACAIHADVGGAAALFPH